MNCPKHGVKMTQLLFRWVCDVCEPPGGPAPDPSPPPAPLPALDFSKVDPLAPLIPPGATAQTPTYASYAGIPKHTPATQTWTLFPADIDAVIHNLDNYANRWMTAGSMVVMDLLRPGNAVLAGGFIRDTLRCVTPKDVDIFYPTEAERNTAAAVFEKSWGKAGPKSISKWARTYEAGSVDIQLIHAWDFDMTDVDLLLDKFDFACNAAAIWMDPKFGLFHSHKHSLAADSWITNKLHVVNGDRVTFERVLKFVQDKGFKFDLKDLPILERRIDKAVAKQKGHTPKEICFSGY